MNNKQIYFFYFFSLFFYIDVFNLPHGQVVTEGKQDFRRHLLVDFKSV